MDNLTPTLNIQQLKENINALQKGGLTIDKVQAYVDNYQKSADGNYTLKTAKSVVPPTQNFGKAPTNISSYIPGEVSNAASGVGKGVIDIAQGSSDLIDRIGSLIPESVKSAFASVAPHLALALKTVGAISPAIGNLEKNVGAQPGSLVIPTNKTEATGKFVGQAGAMLFPTEEAAGLLTKGAEQIGAKLAEKGAEKATQSVIDMTRPILSKAEEASAIAAGKGESATLLKGAKILPTARDLAREGAVQGVVDPAKDLVTNVNNVREAIANEANQTIQGLKQNDVIFNRAQLQTKLKSIEPPLEVQANPIVAKKYDLAQQKFMSFVDAQPKNLSGLLEARKNFDAWIEQKIPKVFDDPTSQPLHTALREMRISANDFIAEHLPSDATSQAFKDSLKKQNLMFEARDNMAERAVKQEVGKSGLKQKVTAFSRAHPIITKAAEYTAVGAVAKKTGLLH